MKGNAKVIERLNEALFLELGAINQYWLHYRLLEDWGYAKLAAKERMESSYLAEIGDFIEPAVAPLGYDGKMGIAVLSSFAAREVFVGTMQTLYPAPDGTVVKVGDLKERLATEIHPATGRPLLTTASAASLIVFYMFAMQCLSTVAIVRSELNSWSWALAQAVGLTVLAYLLAWATHAILA